MSKIIIISAPSGVGKSTIIQNLMQKYKQMCLSVSATTRPIRQGEEHGRDYFFLTEEEFISKKEQGLFVEDTQLHHNRYGTLGSEVQKLLDIGHWVVFDVDAFGMHALKKFFGRSPNVEIIDILLLPQSWQSLKERLCHRGTEKPETIQTRLRNAPLDLQHLQSYKYVIVNDILAECVLTCTTILESHPKLTQDKEPSAFMHAHGLSLLEDTSTLATISEIPPSTPSQ